MAEQSITLNPGESKTVSFEVIPAEARTYQVSVNGLSGSFSAVGAPPDVPEGFEISSLSFTPETTYIGGPIEISIMATNVSHPGAPTFYFHINGEIIAVKLTSYAVPVGETRRIYTTYTPTEARTYQVRIGDLQGSFVATLPELALSSLPQEDLSPVEPYTLRVELSDLAIEPSQVHAGEGVTISVIVTNWYWSGASVGIICTVDGYEIRQSVGFAGGARKLISFQAIPYKAKTFQVEVRGGYPGTYLYGSFTAI